MSAAVLAARACARTILWESLRLAAFRGAVPHVLFVVDQSPCTLQKVLLEGYLQELDLANGVSSDQGGDTLRVDLDPSASTPCYSAGLDKDWKVTYGVLPFRAASFLEEVRTLQAFLRQCGPSVAAGDGITGGRWSQEKMKSAFDSLAPLLSPYAAADGLTGEDTGDCEQWRNTLLCVLPAGPSRELLGCILIQRHAFQNELEKYRLRLDLFNMGLRVAEHNHLECMSRTADALASGKDGGSRERCLEDDEIIYYMQSCSLQPHVAESIGRAIADSIDAWSWKRKTVAADGGEGVPVDVVPPASFYESLFNAGLLSVYNAGVLQWEGSSSAANTRSAAADGFAASLRISGPGAPLRIICHDGEVLSFEGGLEDCLLNTGYYAAAHTEERNCVRRHRQRFPECGADETAKEGGEGERNMALLSGDGEAEKRGRLKKKEYLAMLKLTGKRHVAGRTSSPSNGNEDGVRRGGHDCGACVGSSIGGTFPVGEVISESFDLSKLNGTCSVFAYPSLFKEVTMSEPQPVKMHIEKGIVTDIGPNAPAELVELIGLVRQAEGACYVRELGIGLSPHVGRSRVVSDVTAFERQFGVHISLGQRHPLFVKQPGKLNADGSMAVRVEGPVLKRKAGKYHIDVFLDAARLEMGAFSVDFMKGVCAPPPPLAAAASMTRV
ncbi:hypothetical protein TraAM80_03774 [Trypanosoma rangeli]|uniref:Uncharacterized protein n=1 Tax=Trypanosoma rangeli TaxID=5698 RepID=A0A3R7L3P1_TRYRA|nr:uncharacterized protein TraAM80_03774 [Trypanosoma rangeli]RNF06944.1 hypothetical protein TraAM80_03774 [Trypanosoma rangeli]|eukprot:RNF06944.1 hypothetical protein TraAM80_03774 [Trypanosoma rangeli]